MYNDYTIKKKSINELCFNIFFIWDKSIENEKKSKNKKYLKKNNVRSYKQFVFNKEQFKKENSIVYLLVIHLNNLKWY